MDTNTTDTTDTDAPTIDRRGLLKTSGALLATGATAGLAGCASVIAPGSRKGMTGTLRSKLSGAGVKIRELTWGRPGSDHEAYYLKIEAKAQQEELLAAIAEVSHGYALFVDAVDDPGESIIAALLTPGGEFIGTFLIMAGWAEAYNAGRLSKSAYADKILATVEAAP